MCGIGLAPKVNPKIVASNGILPAIKTESKGHFCAISNDFFSKTEHVNILCIFFEMHYSQLMISQHFAHSFS